MAVLQITIDDSIAVDVRDTLCTLWGYNGPNTNNAKLEFVRTKIVEHVKEAYRTQKAAAVLETLQNVNIT